MAALERELVLDELVLVEAVVRGAVTVVGEVAAVCAETWMAERIVIASKMQRRDIARKAMTAIQRISSCDL